MEFNATLITLPIRTLKDGSAPRPRPDGGDLTLNWIIMDAPTTTTLPLYISNLQRNKVKYLVRVCDKTYRTDVLEYAKIVPIAMPFEDGAKPPAEIVAAWLKLIDDEIEATDPADSRVAPIAVHCLAGLGRAPFLVALGMIEYCGFTAADAVAYIRERRHGAINDVQLRYLLRYTPRRASKGSGGGCTVS